MQCSVSNSRTLQPWGEDSEWLQGITTGKQARGKTGYTHSLAPSRPCLFAVSQNNLRRRPLNNPSRSVRKLVRRWKPFFASSRPALTMHPRRAPRPEPLVPPSTSRVLGAIEAVVVDYLEEWRRDIKCITIADVLSVSPLCSPQEPTPQQAQPRGKSNECARCGVGSIASWRVPPCLCSTCGERFCLGCSRVHECAVAESMAASTSSFCCGWERCMSCKEP